ncbi:MAG: hypothetical protein GC190_20475 [Alphaproteobacteria bacterium]|nr:hypothetical protein [Alphaproteobacteria bacterium]
MKLERDPLQQPIPGDVIELERVVYDIGRVWAQTLVQLIARSGPYAGKTQLWYFKTYQRVARKAGRMLEPVELKDGWTPSLYVDVLKLLGYAT